MIPLDSDKMKNAVENSIVNLIQRFYMGGITLTEKMIVEKEAKEKAHLALDGEDALLKVLAKYPLVFRN
jgi:hypothetical protein